MTMQISDDGKYKWDGNEWVPIDSPTPKEQSQDPTPTTASVSQVTSKKQYAWMDNDESVTDEFSGILEHTNPNPILRIINSMMMLVMSLIGFKQKVTLIVTNKRVIMDIRNYTLYLFESGTDMVTLIRADKVTTGFNSTLLIFKKRYISIDDMLIGTDRKFSQESLESAARNIGKVLK